MRKIILPLGLGALALLSAFTFVYLSDWKITDGYSVKFKGTDVEGVFTSLKGEIKFDESDLTSSQFEVVLDVNSINTGSGMKNKHAKSEKWFDAKQFPTITFSSTAITKSTLGYVAVGKLKIHGVEKQVSLPFTFSNKIFKSSFSVNRLDYQVGDDKGMSAKVSNEIQLDITVPVTQ